MLKIRWIFFFQLALGLPWLANAQGIVEAKYNTISENGEVAVSLDGSGVAPYRYMLSKNPIPALTTLFKEMDAAMGLSAKGLTPKTFLPQDEYSPKHFFSDLDLGQYFVKVWDANDTLLFDNAGVDVAPEFKLAKAVKVSANGNELSTSSANGWSTTQAIIQGGFLINDKTSNLFEVTVSPNLPDCFIAAEPDMSGSIPKVPTDIFAGIYFKGPAVTLILDGKVIASKQFAPGDRLLWGFEDGHVILQNNGNTIFKGTLDKYLPGAVAGVVCSPVVSFGSNGSLKLTPLQPMVMSPISTQVAHGACGVNYGSIAITENIFPQASNVSYILYNSAGGVVGSQNGSPLSQNFSNLSPGDYLLKYSYTMNWWWGSQSVTKLKTLSVGINAQWNPVTTAMVISGNSIYCATSNSAVLPMARGDAENHLPANQAGWVDFQISYAGQNQYSIYGLGGVPGLTNPVNQANYPVLMFKGNWFTYIENYDGNPATYFITTNNRFRMDRDNAGQLSLFNGTSTTPAFKIPGYTSDFYIGAALRSKKDGFINVISSYGCSAPKTFVRPEKELDGSFYKTVNGKLFVQYQEEYNHPNINYNVYDERNSLVTTNPPTQFNGYGENGLEFDFSSLPANQYYVLEIVNAKSEKWFLRFVN